MFATTCQSHMKSISSIFMKLNSAVQNKCPLDRKRGATRVTDAFMRTFVLTKSWQTCRIFSTVVYGYGHYPPFIIFTLQLMRKGKRLPHHKSTLLVYYTHKNYYFHCFNDLDNYCIMTTYLLKWFVQSGAVTTSLKKSTVHLYPSPLHSVCH